MSARTSANRYARALLDVVLQEAVSPEQVERELAAFADLFRTPELHQALTHPAVPASAKRGVVRELTARQQPAAPLGKLLLLLADRDRLALVPELAEAYRARLREHRGILQAEITTAEPLDPGRATELRQRLAAATGREVLITTKVDPAIIGGAVTRVESTVYDGSIATQLERVRTRLVEQR